MNIEIKQSDCDATDMEAAFVDREQFVRYMRLLSDSQKVATRVFPKHREN